MLIEFAETRSISMVVWSVSLQDAFGNMLLYPLLQSLGSTAHVPTIIVA